MAYLGLSVTDKSVSKVSMDLTIVLLPGWLDCSVMETLESMDCSMMALGCSMMVYLSRRRRRRRRRRRSTVVQVTSKFDANCP